MDHNRKTFSSPGEELSEGAKGLIEEAKRRSGLLRKPIDPVDCIKRRDDNVAALIAEIRKQESLVAGQEYLERLTEVERACLDSMKSDFYDRGIVAINENATVKDYQVALTSDKNAGTNWDSIQERLLAHEATLLKKAVEMSILTGFPDGKGVCLIGIFDDGRLAIRQRNQEIMNARWTKDWEGIAGMDTDRGELLLERHKSAILLSEGRWADGPEIIWAVEKAGFQLPMEQLSSDGEYKKQGLVAASEAVTGSEYVRSSADEHTCAAVLDRHPDNIRSDGALISMVEYYAPSVDDKTVVKRFFCHQRRSTRGAIIWVIG